MKRLSVLLAIAGLGVAALLLAWFDVGAVWAATVSVGWAGFLALLAWQGVLFVLLGLAWTTVLPGVSPALLVWGRMVRDAATTCLPFSPVGGYVIGARAITLQGVAWTAAAAGTVVDVTAEIIAQMVFSLFGAAVVLLLLPDATFAAPVAAGVAVALALLLLLVWQRARVGQAALALGTHLAGEAFRAQGGFDRLRIELARLYRPERLVRGAALHLAGWFATGVGTWIALHLLGASVDMLHVLALEALLDALVAAAFVVPGAAGVQEAGYVGIGALFGVPADLALSVSLLRRGKDLVWGLPILAAWQWREVRRLRTDRQPSPP
jgi:putative membrane protein